MRRKNKKKKMENKRAKKRKKKKKKKKQEQEEQEEQEAEEAEEGKRKSDDDDEEEEQDVPSCSGPTPDAQQETSPEPAPHKITGKPHNNCQNSSAGNHQIRVGKTIKIPVG